MHVTEVLSEEHSEMAANIGCLAIFCEHRCKCSFYMLLVFSKILICVVKRNCRSREVEKRTLHNQFKLTILLRMRYVTYRTVYNQSWIELCAISIVQSDPTRRRVVLFTFCMHFIYVPSFICGWARSQCYSYLFYHIRSLQKRTSISVKDMGSASNVVKK